MPRVTRRRPMSNRNRARLGGLAKVANNGLDHMAATGRRGAEALDRRIAKAAGIPEDAPDYAARLKAARTAYYIRLSEARWAKAKGARP